MLGIGTATVAMAAGLPTEARHVVDCTPVESLKARKNATEIAGLAEAGRRDAAAIVSYFAWLEGAVPAGGFSRALGHSRAPCSFGSERFVIGL